MPTAMEALVPDIRHHSIAPGEVRFKAGDTEGVFTGYAATFNDLVPSYRERVLPGAFSRTLSEWRALGKKFPILAAHDPGRVIGLIDPANLVEDERGLRMNGAELVLETQDGREHYALIKRGLVSLSIGFWPVKTSKNDRGETLIEDAELAEISVVYAGASPNATITSIRSKEGAMPQATTEQTTNESAPEQRSQAAPAAEVVELRSQIAELRSTVEELEVRSQRPGRQTEQRDTAAHDLALRSYLREGRNGLNADQTRTLTAGSNAAGGYLVIPEYSRTIIEGVTNLSPMRALSSVMSIGTDKVVLPKMTTRLSGGWVTETGARPSSQPVFDQQEISVFEHAVIVPMTTQLVEDSMINLPAYISAQIARQFAIEESVAFTKGDGNGKPTGFLDDPDVFEAVEFDQANLNLNNTFLEALIDLFYQLPADYAANATWQMKRKTMGIIRKLADLSDNGAIWSDSLANGEPARFLGRPVAANEYMDDIVPAVAGDTVPVAIGDFNQGYTIVDRVNLEFLNDPFTGADNGIWKLRARRRVGGAVTKAEAIQVLKATAA